MQRHDQRNVTRRKRYKMKCDLQKARTDIYSLSPTVVEKAKEVIQHGLQTVCGRRMLGGLSSLLEERIDEDKKSVTNVVNAFSPLSPVRKHVLGLAGSAYSGRKVLLAKELKVSPSYLYKAIKLDKQHDIFSLSNRQKVSQIGPIEGKLLVAFIRSEASAKSGQKRRVTGETLYTDQTLFSLHNKYKMECFQLYLAEAKQDPKYHTLTPPSSVSEHEANCWHALWRSQQPDFDLLVEIRKRAAMSRQEVPDGCCQPTNLAPTRGRPCTKDLRQNFDPSKWTIVPRSWGAITDFLKTFDDREKAGRDEKQQSGTPGKQNKKKWKGITVLTTTDQKSCSLCQFGPTNMKKLEKIEEEIAKSPDNIARMVLESQQHQLRSKVGAYKRHLESLANQRAYLKRCELETLTDETKAVLYRDFVSWYARDGTKVRDLVFVLIRKNKPVYIHNIYWGDEAGCDSYFVVDACDHLFTKVPLLDKVEQLTVGGDHGPCFSSRKTMYWESLVYELTKAARKNRKKGLELLIDFLTSYHAFGRHDGAGMVLKCMHTRWSLENDSTGNGELLRAIVNDGYARKFTKSHSRMVAFLFDKINYGRNIFAAVDGPDKTTKDYNCKISLRPIESVRYSWKLPDGTTARIPGVMRVRALSDRGEWTFVDTRHSATSLNGRMCTLHTAASGFPVYHGENTCQDDDEVMVSAQDRVQPLHDRMAESGEQLAVRKKSRTNKKSSSAVTVRQLKVFLKSRNLSTSGTKDVLWTRAREAEADVNIISDEHPEEDEEEEEEEEENVDDNQSSSSGGEKTGSKHYSSDSSEHAHVIEKIETWRIVGKRNPQEQFYVRWQDDEQTWETHETLTKKWLLASPYDDDDFLEGVLAEVRKSPKATKLSICEM